MFVRARRITATVVVLRKLLLLASRIAALLVTPGCQSHEQVPAVGDPVGTTAAALSSDAGPASPSIGSFALQETEAIELSSGSVVTGCNVGVEGTAGPFLGGGAAAHFNSGATIQSTQTLHAYSTYLNSGASLGPDDTGSSRTRTRRWHRSACSTPSRPHRCPTPESGSCPTRASRRR